ncbi:hypothetical protein FOZ62_013741, partial [Perkinsus olseni]
PRRRRGAPWRGKQRRETRRQTTEHSVSVTAFRDMITLVSLGQDERGSTEGRDSLARAIR